MGDVVDFKIASEDGLSVTKGSFDDFLHSLTPQEAWELASDFEKICTLPPKPKPELRLVDMK
jgi:hypothetical protein